MPSKRTVIVSLLLAAAGGALIKLLVERRRRTGAVRVRPVDPKARDTWADDGGPVVPIATPPATPA